MKKTLLSSLLVFSVLANAQTQKTINIAPNEPASKMKRIGYSEARKNNKQVLNKTAGTGSAWFNQIDFLELINPGVMSFGFMPVFPDSSIILGFDGSNNPVYAPYHKAANYIDPKFMAQQTIITNQFATYTMDSLYFGYAYERKTNAPDSVIIQIIGENQALNFTTGNPAYPYQDIEYQYTTDKLKATVPVLKTLRYELLPTDTAAGYKQLAFSTAGMAAITGSKKVGVVISFKPGYSWTITDTLYDGHMANIFWVVSAEGNGDGGGAGTDPTIFGTANDYTTNMNMSYILPTDIRYNMNANGWNGYLIPTFAYTTPYSYETHDIGYKLTCTNVGVEELKSNGYLLGQNVPNPFSGQTTINYELAKEAASVSLTVTDVMGRMVSSQKGETSTGVHALTVSAISAGVYYYTLNVDGKTTTRKMIVE